MVEIVLIACLIGAPETCSEHSLPPFTGVSVMQCTMGAQPWLARWTLAHPDHRIAGWHCRPALQSHAL